MLFREMFWKKKQTSVLKSFKSIHIHIHIPFSIYNFSPQNPTLLQTHKKKKRKHNDKRISSPFFFWKMNRVQNNIWYQRYKQTSKPIIIIIGYLYLRSQVVRYCHKRTDHIFHFGTIFIFLIFSSFIFFFRIKNNVASLL